jgi:outer membrane lipoprotein SlyB
MHKEVVMTWMAKAMVIVAMLVSIPTAGCQVVHTSDHAAKAREETTVRSDTYSTALPQNVDRSLQREVQTAQSTIRSDENIRAGGSTIGGGTRPPPPTGAGSGK